jgi:hypothetical protein
MIKKSYLGDTTQLAYPTKELSDELLAAKNNLIEDLGGRDGRGTQVFLDHKAGVLEMWVGGRQMVVIFGSAKNQFDQLLAEEGGQEKAGKLRAAIGNFLQQHGGNIFVVTGGTDQGVEAIVHEEAKKHQVPVFKALTSVAKVDYVVDRSGRADIVGHYWEDLGPRVFELADRYDGLVFIVGGGAIIEKQIALLAKSNLKFGLAQDVPPQSAAQAPKFPKNRFSALDPNGFSVFFTRSFPKPKNVPERLIYGGPERLRSFQWGDGAVISIADDFSAEEVVGIVAVDSLMVGNEKNVTIRFKNDGRWSELPASQFKRSQKSYFQELRSRLEEREEFVDNLVSLQGNIPSQSPLRKLIQSKGTLLPK